MPFPTTPVLEDCSGADEDPLDTRWDGSHNFISGDTGRHALLSHLLTNATAPNGGTDTSTSYDGASGVQQFSGDIEVWATISVASTVAADQFKVLAMNERNAPTQDGYELHVEKVAGAGNDIWRLRRRDNVTPTVISPGDLTPTEIGASNIGIGMRVYASGTLEAWYASDGVNYSLVGTRTDTTYVGPWWIGIKTAQASPLAWKISAFGGGTVVTAEKQSFYVSRRRSTR
jgi:hypothetical protein